MLLDSAVTMNRKALALAIVLLVAGLAPATAIIGFCARMPCCSHGSNATTAAFSTERNDCCTTIACYESPSLKLSTAPTSADAVLVAPALIITTAPAIAPAPIVTQAFADTSPPLSSRHRLAVLSTLLI
ncbi:MAG: hypothetical protein JWO97_4447 [Acidobacteria bacterium]|nr:hypothetical protein [Acidobacteriota bacterium]